MKIQKLLIDLVVGNVSTILYTVSRTERCAQLKRFVWFVIDLNVIL